MRAGRLDHLVDILPTPGLTDSVTIIYLATECSPAERDLHGPEERHMTLLHLPLVDALAMIDRGEVADAKTVVGLLATQRWLERSDRDVRDVPGTPVRRGSGA